MDLADQVTRTKILLPRRRPELLSRQRLLDLLYDLLDHKLVIIAAPAGYGKTSLLVDAAHRLELPVCWFAIDPLDRDLQRFIAHIIASIQQRFPAFGGRSTAALQSNPDLSPQRLLTVIINEIYDQIREYFFLVLDDYHLVDNSPEIVHFVSQFIQQVSENCHVIITSRTLLSLPDLPLMIGRSQVGGLSFEELAFRPEEIQALVLQNQHQTISKSEAEAMVRVTEGWITGLLLSAQALPLDHVKSRVARVSGVGVYEYLAQQVLDQQRPSVRDFLLRTSLLEEFDANLCEVVLGPASYEDGWGWPELIDFIQRHNLFVQPVDHHGTWLRYHHLFRDFLQSRLMMKNPQEHQRLLRRLAEVYCEREEWERGLDFYCRLKDFAAIAATLERAALSLLHEGRLKLLAKWLAALPAEMLPARLFLLALQGYVAYRLGQLDRGLTLLGQAEAAAKERQEPQNLAWALAWRAMALNTATHYHASIKAASEALALNEADSGLDTAKVEALRAKGLSLYGLGEPEEALGSLQQSLELCHKLKDCPEQKQGLLCLGLGMIYEGLGKYTNALGWYEQALTYIRGRENAVFEPLLLNNLGVLYHLMGSYEQAISTLGESLRQAEQSGDDRTRALALASLGDLYADLDLTEAALNLYVQAFAISEQITFRFLLFYLNLARTRLARLAGDRAGARMLLALAKQVAHQSDASSLPGEYWLEAGQLAQAEKRFPEAIGNYNQALSIFIKGDQHVEIGQTRFYLALSHHLSGDKDLAQENLEKSLAQISSLENWHLLAKIARKEKQFWQDMPVDAVTAQLLNQLLASIADFEKRIPSLRRHLRQEFENLAVFPPELAIHTLGESKVVLNSKILSGSDWQVKKARDLFFYLLAHPDGKTKETLGEIFWPDHSPAQVKLQFKNTIYRLRRALFSDVIILDEQTERYKFNRNLDYEYDVETFAKKLTSAQMETDNLRQIAAYEEAISVYGGDYLPDVDDLWPLADRERLQALYFEALLKLAELHFQAKNYEPVIDHCRIALTIDPCLEEACRLSMRAYAALGNRAAVVRQFEQCRLNLMAEVNTVPSPQTISLYKQLAGSPEP
ncbi:MAG TPA: tetratricopeptide repeat protein [Anaerolineae bacterium]|nr:tetratricopeptide repeat protein [Anaerolineae bacterium]HMR63733.1 tetratricopeptide repeat protein [Anaerolineae bacterium]